MSTTQQVPEVRKGAAGQGAILIAAASMPILGSTSIAPLQPAMAAAFPDQANATVLVSLILTAPALMMGLTALIAGRFIDRVGRKRVMVIGLLIYAIAGTAPLWLPTLQSILVSRIFVGLAEAGIFAAALAGISDLFEGRRRARYFGLLTLVTGVAAVVFIAASGALGSSSWRTPFWLYTVAVPIAVFAMIFLPRFEASQDTGKLPPMRWGAILRPIIFTFVGGAIFYVVVSMLSLRLADMGVTQTAVIGGISAVAALALALAAMAFPALLNRIPGALLALAFGFLGAGLVVLGLAPTIPVAVAGAIIANMGGGVLISALQNWIVQGLPYDQRGRASGASTSALFIGQFFAPLIVLGIGASTGMGPAIAILGAVGLLAALLAAFVGRLKSDDVVVE